MTWVTPRLKDPDVRTREAVDQCDGVLQKHQLALGHNFRHDSLAQSVFAMAPIQPGISRDGV